MAVIKNQTPVNVDPNKIATGIRQAAAVYNEQKEKAQEGAAKFAEQYGPQITPTLPEIRQSTAQSNQGNPYQAQKIEETIGGNNYYMPYGQRTTQGQYNALNGTGHVAGMPQGPSGLVEPDYSQMQSVGAYVPEQTNTPTTQPTAQKGISQTKQTGVTTPQTGQEQQPAEDIANWQIPESWKKQKEETPANNMNEQALADMEADLGGDNTGMLYGKVTADTNGGNGVQTVSDPYNVERATNQARIANLKKLQTMSSEDIATSITGGYTPYGEQAMRDLMQYNPQKYAEVQQFIKQQKGQDSINSITSGNVSGMNTTQTAVDNVNNGVDGWADGLSTSPQQAGQLVTNISNSMANNGVATTATQEMLNLNEQMADIQEKMSNIKIEAQKAFKGDVPQYIVDAYANNRLQEYQSQYNKLESRYNAAMDLYKTELSQAQRQEEMNLKKAQFQQDIDNEQRDRYYKSQQLLQSNIKRVDGTAYQVDPTTGTFVKLTDQTAILAYQNDVDNLMKGRTSLHYDGEYVGYQCEQFTDNFTEASVGIRMTGADERSRTTAAEKLSYTNDLTPSVGNVIVAVGGAYDSTYGHTMLITGYDPTTGLIDLMRANSNGDNTIHTSTTTLDTIRRNSQAMGIRNPYKTKVEQSINQSSTDGQYAYYGFNTPMATAFERISSDSSLSGTQRNALPIAMEMYNTLYEIANNGQLDALVDNGDLALVLNDMKNKKFSSSDNGEKFLSAFSKALTNKATELAGGDASYSALMALQRVVEAKLRDESGAAISSSEWQSNFSYLLPQAGESETVKQEKLKARDRIISTKFITAGGKMSEYIPIFDYSTIREIR